GESAFASGPTREPTPDNGSDGLPEGGLPGSVKPLLTSPSALLLLGTLGVGLLAVVFYRLLHRRGAAETKAPSVPRVLRR
ncbi:MAG: hypothetical protein M3316_09115, partial [Actinomycetota bacterium]|nr:hypothetical protein [Actinomycetota bacterium]